MLAPPSSSFSSSWLWLWLWLWLLEGPIVPDPFKVFKNLNAVFILCCCKAEGIAGPFTEEEGALLRGEEVGAHEGDVVGFGAGPD